MASLKLNDPSVNPPTSATNQESQESRDLLQMEAGIQLQPRKQTGILRNNRLEENRANFSASILLIVVQSILIVSFYFLVSYDGEADAKFSERILKRGGDAAQTNSLASYYPMFQDVHVMIFVGFGFLMTFLKRYGFSAVGYNFLLAAIAIQWSILCHGLIHGHGTDIHIGITNLIQGDFAAGAVLISFGAILGVSTPIQLLVMVLIEVFIYALNEYIGAELFQAIDVGGSMYIHTFGAYFGLAVSFILQRHRDLSSDNGSSSYTSDIFAMIGTIFLWMFWPSFNVAMASGDAQHRGVVNTVMSLSGSCLLSFAMSSLLNPHKKFNMVHIQNASLAGGVAIGAVADLMIQPFGALIVGSGAGILSTIGYVYISPLLQQKIGLHDTCGVHNLHGMPGVFAGLVGAIMAAVASEDSYGVSLYLQYPARSPLNGTLEQDLLQQQFQNIDPGLGRSGSDQALYQLAGLGVTMVMAIIGGILTGLLLSLKFFSVLPQQKLFNDSYHWELEEENENQS